MRISRRARDSGKLLPLLTWLGVPSADDLGTVNFGLGVSRPFNISRSPGLVSSLLSSLTSDHFQTILVPVSQTLATLFYIVEVGFSNHGQGKYRGDRF